MALTIDLPLDIEQAYRAAAHAKGMSLDHYMREILIAGQPNPIPTESLFEQGLGLFGSPDDASLLDEVVATAYEERTRPSRRPVI